MENNKWHTFVIAIGLLFIASSPLLEKSMLNVIIGVIIVVIGFILMRKKKGD